jgi:hypothetical protein
MKKSHPYAALQTLGIILIVLLPAGLLADLERGKDNILSSPTMLWPRFSLTEHAAERKLIIKSQDFRGLEKISGEKVKVYVATAHICNNPDPEVLAYLVHPDYCGSHGCALSIYKRRGNTLLHLKGILMNIDVEKGKAQLRFGIVNSETNTCKDIVVNGNVWRTFGLHDWAPDLNGLYASNYEKFWSVWNFLKKKAVSCEKSSATSEFLLEAVMLRGAEVTEANAEVIEQLSIEKPGCILNGLAELKPEDQEVVLIFFC